jgi:hypothetical protein
MAAPLTRLTIEQRFFSKIVASDRTHLGWLGYPTPCLEWKGWKGAKGHGKFAVDAASRPQKTVPAHRWLYERWVGLVPPELDLDHLCRWPPCANPFHCEPVPMMVNLNRGKVSVAAGDFGPDVTLRSEIEPHMSPYEPLPVMCDQGHAIGGDNIWVPNKDCITPKCRTCRNAWRRKYRQVRKSQGQPLT